MVENVQSSPDSRSCWVKGSKAGLGVQAKNHWGWRKRKEVSSAVAEWQRLSQGMAGLPLLGERCQGVSEDFSVQGLRAPGLSQPERTAMH